MCMRVCAFLHRKGSPSFTPGIQSGIAQQVKYVNRNALSMFKALSKGFR